MLKTEHRGEHATGFWACLEDENKIIYHKEPVKSSVFVNHKLWAGLEDMNPNLLIGHCRWTTPGGGPEKVNKNNHPHVSHDYRVALVHNGKIPEYNYLKKRYDTITDCDSEVLLRIFESGENHHDQIEFLRKQLPKVFNDTPDELLYRIFGLSKIFSEINYGAMAVAIGEKLDGNNRSLFLFRNDLRPITLIDLRESLGQIFFCSTPEIFRQSIDASPLAQKLIPANQAVIPELPDNWIYSFVYKKEVDIKEFEIRRFKVNKITKYGCWENSNNKSKEEDPPKSLTKLERSSVNILTNLNKDEEIISNYIVPTVITQSSLPLVQTVSKLVKNTNKYPPFVIDDDELESSITDNKSTLHRETTICTNVLNNGFQEVGENDKKSKNTYDEIEGIATPEMCEEFDVLCKQVTQIIEQIQVTLYNKFQEGSITKNNIEDISQDLKSTIRDLKATEFTISK